MDDADHAMMSQRLAGLTDQLEELTDVAMGISDELINLNKTIKNVGAVLSAHILELKDK